MWISGSRVRYVGDPFELFKHFFSSADPLSVAYEPELETLPVIPSAEKDGAWKPLRTQSVDPEAYMEVS